MASGSVGSNASTRSSTPPCPGNRPLLSLTPALRLNQRLDQITDHAHRRQKQHRQHHERTMPCRQAGYRCWARPNAASAPSRPRQTNAAQRHPPYRPTGTFPAFPGTDGRCQLACKKAPAQGLASKIGRDIGNPHQSQHRKQKIDANHPRLSHRQPGHPQRKNTADQAKQPGHVRTTWRRRRAAARRQATTQALAQHKPQQCVGRRPTKPCQRHTHSAGNTAHRDAQRWRHIRFNRAHSQAPAAMKTMASAQNGAAVGKTAPAARPASNTMQ